MTPPQEQDPALSSLDPLPGRVVAGNFRIDKLIGAGAMGNVYRALQLSLNKAVAVKVLHQHLMSDEKLVARFKREAKSASMLNHPNSIQIIDSGQDTDGLLYIAMELLVGRDLAQVIRDDFPLPLPRVVRILSQVLSALDEAHAQGVIHRDLKPSNVMLVERRGEKDFVKVCDFGIAKATDSGDDRAAMLTIQGLVCGTPEYMSPEQARAEAIDGRADLYSAAVILYQLATGDIPFRADSPMGIVSRHLAETPVPPSIRRPDLKIPSMLDDIVLHGMEKARELRFPTAIAFRDALEVMLNATLGPPTPLPPGIRASMPTATALRGSGAHDAARPGSTGELPTQPARDRFGTTADMTGQGNRRNKLAVAIGTIAMLTLCAAGAVFIARFRHEARPVPRSLAAMATPAPLAPEPAASPEPPAAVELVKAAPTPTTPPRGAALRDRLKRELATKPQRVEPAIAVPQPEAVPPAPPPPAPPEPPTRGAREVLGEADKLLAQGEVADACARGEEAKRLGPKLASVYKFLGKCYMRAGKTRDANDNYRQYLELAPNAPDAPFVKSMIK